MDKDKSIKDFLPVILGTDINTYSMCASFHEEYGIKPIVIGKTSFSFTKYTTIIQKLYLNDELRDSDEFVHFMIEVAKKEKLKAKKLILVGTNDFYVKLIIKNRTKLEKYYEFNYIKEDLFKTLYSKKNFYKLCKEYNIDIPTTYFYSALSDKKFNEDINFPVILKPSSGIEYYNNPFENMQKIYRLNSHEEINNIIDIIKKSGYKSDIIIQDYIPGDDTYMWDSVYYGNKHGKGQLVTFAQVVLQEHTKTAIGNYTALIVRHNREFMEKLVHFMEAIGYVGFGNFDIKYDYRDQKFKLFEVNIRQGRSSYYTTQCGHNMARYFVDDLIYNKSKEITYLDDEFLFTVVPKIVLRRFVENPKIKKEVNQLIKKGKFGNPLFYKNDKSIKRKLYMFLRQVNYYKKYSDNKW
ncbi:MAG: carboxylate--amine ligase [Clostridium sp.]|nr:carboxylate--amine ligase [Clostridium sp.]